MNLVENHNFKICVSRGKKYVKTKYVSLQHFMQFSFNKIT